MTKRPKATILDIARAAGVSKSTVSLVLQGSDLVRPDTADRVRKAIEDVGYVYNRGAANLRKAHSNVIGMVVNDLTNPFYAELAVGMERAFQSAGVVPFIANTGENPVRQEEVLKSMLEQGAAGLIVSPARGTPPDAFRRIEATGVPIVFAMRRMPDSRIPVVAPDNRRGAALAARHLLGKGHSRIAFFGGSSDLVVYQERLGGFREACREYGLHDSDVQVFESDTSRKGGMTCIDLALASETPPTAALCFNDAQHYVPSLTSVAVDTAGLGERAAHIVLKMIQSRTTSAENHIGAVNLVVRESCGPDRNSARGV